MKNQDVDLIGDFVDVFRLLLKDSCSNDTLTRIQRIVSLCRGIFASSSVAQVFAYLCLNGAATTWTLQNELDMSEATAYRALKKLRSMKVIVPAFRVAKAKSSKGGPRPTIWAIRGATTEEISQALQLHYRIPSPKFRVTKQIAQTILDEYIAPRQVFEISYREIVIKVKELRIPFSTPDIADLAASYLHEKGVKVWR